MNPGQLKRKLNPSRFVLQPNNEVLHE